MTTTKHINALEQLRDPLRLRVAVCLAAVAAGYLGLYAPINTRIESAARQLQEQKRRAAIVQDVATLETQQALLAPRLGAKDTGQCVQTLVDGVRQLHLKVVRLEPTDSKRLGPLEAAAIQLDVEGEMPQLDALLCWLDTCPLLFRVDSLRIAPPRDAEGRPLMQLKLLLLKEPT